MDNNLNSPSPNRKKSERKSPSCFSLFKCFSNKKPAPNNDNNALPPINEVNQQNEQ